MGEWVGGWMEGGRERGKGKEPQMGWHGTGDRAEGKTG